jgi:regulator of PEP synthase PpsR (kinase-PPPase family)
MSQPGNLPTVHIISDATGETAYRVARAALAQFKDDVIDLDWNQGVRTPERIHEIVERAAAGGGLIIHSLVVPGLRQVLIEETRRHGVECVDVIGPVLMHFAEWLGRKPSQQPGITRRIGQEYFKRITAMEFAVEHDDGRKPDELDRADLVLVGVSRASKTPLSIYFAYRGWLVGNVPLVPGVEPPPILFELPPQRVVGLTLSQNRLTTIRTARQQWLGVSGAYGDKESIREELRFARSVFARGGWNVIDMSVKSIEEAATEILALIAPGEELLPGNGETP